MYAQKESPRENKSRAVANSVAQKKSNRKQGSGFVDNRNLKHRNNLHDIIEEKINYESRNGMQRGFTIQRKLSLRESHPGLISNPKFNQLIVSINVFNFDNDISRLNLIVRQLESFREIDPVFYEDMMMQIREESVFRPIEETKSQSPVLEDPLAQVTQIAAVIPKSMGMDCDRWARDFQAELAQSGIEYTPKIVLIRPERKLGALAINAHIKIGEQVIGNDSHFYTIVQGVVFDNLHPKGVKEAEHKSSMTYWLNDPEEQQEESSVVIRYNLPATAVLELHPTAAIRKDMKEKKKK